jgi:cytochrome b
MTTETATSAGDPGVRVIRVWDPLVRLIHWSVVAAIILNGFVTDPESELHEFIGYGVLAVVLLRLTWGIVGTEHARFQAFPPNPAAALRHVQSVLRRENGVHLSHNPLGSLMVYNIWATLLAMCATGIMMGTVRFFGVGWVEQAHELAFDWLMVSVVLHVLGVIFETWLNRVPLVRAMITGNKHVPSRLELK